MSNPMTNEAALKLARQIAAKDARNSYPMFGSDILAGRCDDAPRVRCALAAILEVTERAAGLAESDALILSESRSPASFGKTRKNHGELIAARLRNHEHMKV